MKDLTRTGYIHQAPTKLPHPKGNVYVGIGLSGKNLLSEGVPFDILPYILSSILVKRVYDLDQAYVLIADTHAKNNIFTDAEEVAKNTQEIEQIILKIIDAFEIKDCTVLRASDITCNQDYQDKLSEYRQVFENDYVVRELADIWYFHHRLNTKVKVSWKDPKGKLKYDESYFDTKYTQVETIGPEFVYSIPGFDFRSGYRYVSPYTFFSDQLRLHLHPSQPLQDQINSIQDHTSQVKVQSGEEVLEAQMNVIEAIWGEAIPGQTIWDKVHIVGDQMLKI